VSDAVGPVEPTAKQRLQATRQALMHELVPSTKAESAPRSGMRGAPTAERVAEQAIRRGAITPVPSQDAADTDVSEARRSASGWLSVARHSVRAWWEFHPVRVVGVVAQPVLAEYARQRPLKLVGIAAGVGALVIVTRPWRLVSLGGLAVAALKSSQVSNFALTFLSNRKNNRK